MVNAAMEEESSGSTAGGTSGNCAEMVESCVQFCCLRPIPSLARYIYALVFLATNLLAWAIRDYGRHFLSEIEKLKGCHGYQYCLGAEGVLRVSFGCFMFFFVMFLSTVGTKKLQDPRSSWHSDWWPVKIMMWTGFMFIPFFIPTEFFRLYGKIAHFGAGAFLVIQLMSMISFVTWLNDWFYSEENEQRCRCQVMALSVATYVASISAIILMYVWYVYKGSCQLNAFFIASTLAFLLLMAFVSVHPKVNAGHLAPALMGLYIVYLCWSAIRSEPVTETCEKASIGFGNWLTIMSFVMAILVIVVATFSTGIDSKWPQVHFRHVPIHMQLIFSEILVRFQLNSMQFMKSAVKSEDDVPYGFGFFHMVFALGAMYFAMLFIGWNEHITMEKWTIDVGWVSTWVRISNEWVASVVYIWMMMAPLILKNRRQVDAVNSDSV